ncbi:hypothetical protein [Gallaecimonas pentaromativorans]|uniref:hypothetical protein n=1 Tax=Gallaecimonas pentaromativorans TaxID=584787 RepID=UPI003A9284B9
MSMANGGFIEPGLSKAIEQWQAYFKESMESSLGLMSAVNPLKDAAEVTQKVSQAMVENLSSGKIAPPPAEALKELSELQSAGAQRLWEGCTQTIKDSRSATEKLLSFDGVPSTPQGLLTHLLQSNLAAVKQYQADASAMASTMSEMQSAYNAWLDKYFLKVQ